MRKVNLRNVDPAIDDPDASTWSHPTLNRNSQPEVVANFKRRVPPRLPKVRKRESQQDAPHIPPPNHHHQQPRSATGLGPGPLALPDGLKTQSIGARARGFSAPGAYPPNLTGSNGWMSSGNSGYQRQALPPLTVPSDPPHLSHTSSTGHIPSATSHHHHMSHYPITPDEESPTYGSSSYGHPSAYGNSYQQHNYSAPQEPSWTASSHGGSLSSLLNPASQQQNSSQYSSAPRPHPINTNTTSNYSSSQFSAMPIGLHSRHSPPPLSPDTHSRPNTGYSMSSVDSVPYDDYSDYQSRPNSSHRPPSASPVSRPGSSHFAPLGSNSLSVRRNRRHSQISPYPSPYDNGDQQRPSTSPQPFMHMNEASHYQHGHSSQMPSSNYPRVRGSMLPGVASVDSYGFTPNHADFAYS
jgi:hypothetical protein